MSGEVVTIRVYPHGDDPDTRRACDLAPHAAHMTCERHPVTGVLGAVFMPPFDDLWFRHEERLSPEKTARLRKVLELLGAAITKGVTHA